MYMQQTFSYSCKVPMFPFHIIDSLCQEADLFSSVIDGKLTKSFGESYFEDIDCKHLLV